MWIYLLSTRQKIRVLCRPFFVIGCLFRLSTLGENEACDWYHHETENLTLFLGYWDSIVSYGILWTFWKIFPIFWFDAVWGSHISPNRICALKLIFVQNAPRWFRYRAVCRCQDARPSATTMFSLLWAQTRTIYATHVTRHTYRVTTINQTMLVRGRVGPFNVGGFVLWHRICLPVHCIVHI